MSNTINVNYMTRAYNQYQQKNAAKDQEKEDTRFADSVREKSEASGSIVGNSKIGSVSAKDMTMVEYKQYIYNKISQIPMHPTRAGESISVTISEAGFEAMKNDPEYEAYSMGINGVSSYANTYTYGNVKNENVKPSKNSEKNYYAGYTMNSANKFKNVSDYSKYLTNKYKCLTPCKNASVLIDRSVMQKACGDEKTAKWLEENLAIMPDVIRDNGRWCG